MSATTVSITPPSVTPSAGAEAVGVHQSPAASQPEGATISAVNMVTVVTVVLALVAVLGMFTIFAAVAGSLPTVLACAFVSVVVCVATAFHLLRRVGM